MLAELFDLQSTIQEEGTHPCLHLPARDGTAGHYGKGQPARPGQARPRDGTAGQGRAGQGRAGHGTARHGRAGQGRARHGRARHRMGGERESFLRHYSALLVRY